jgi:tape measure domain-containing protein
MAKVTTDLTVVIKTAGDAGLDKLTRTLNGLGQQAKSAAAPFDQISKELKEVQRTSKNSIANLRGYRNAWRDITQQVEIGSTAFKEATAEAARLDRQLQKAEGRKGKGPGVGGRLRGAAQVVGTVAGAGIFGGPEGAAGALLGSIGGPAGAIVGGAIGAQIGQLRQLASQMGEIVARVNSLKIALAGVSTSQEDYNVSLKSAIGFSKDFLIPIDDTIKQYTRLKASVVGAGGSTKDTDKAFRGMAAAVLATGGDVQDFNSALVATAQVFSKGKVSAEELRQQIGERLPGAFTIFADSMGISTRELDKLLEGGKVDLSSFGAFTETLFERFGKTAKIIGDAPEKAGQRLQVALAFASLEYGGFFQKVGAGFQDYATNLVNFAIDNKETFKNVAANVVVFVQDFKTLIKDLAASIKEAFGGLFVFIGKALVAFVTNFVQPFFNTIFAGIEGLLSRMKLGQAERKLGGPFGRAGEIRIEELKAFNKERGMEGVGRFGISAAQNDEIERKAQARILQEAGMAPKAREDKFAEAFAGIEKAFAAFNPDTFGTGIGSSNQSLTGGEDAGGGGSQAKVKDVSKEVLRLTQEMNAAKATGQLITAEQLRLELDIQRITEQFNAGTITFNKAQELSSNAIEASRARGVRLLQKERKELAGVGKAQDDVNEKTKSYEITLEKIKDTLANQMTSAIEGLIDGTKTLGESLSGVLRTFASMFLKAGMGSFVDTIFNAKGNVYANNKIVPFASGGVVNKPTIFPMANGMGLMGEAGPEAIMPLRRGANGKLGVESSGGASNVVVNVDASGSSVEGNDDQAAQLGKAIGIAVQQELIKQKRPGGLLTS